MANWPSRAGRRHAPRPAARDTVIARVGAAALATVVAMVTVVAWTTENAGEST